MWLGLHPLAGQPQSRRQQQGAAAQAPSMHRRWRPHRRPPAGLPPAAPAAVGWAAVAGAAALAKQPGVAATVAAGFAVSCGLAGAQAALRPCLLLARVSQSGGSQMAGLQSHQAMCLPICLPPHAPEPMLPVLWTARAAMHRAGCPGAPAAAPAAAAAAATVAPLQGVRQPQERRRGRRASLNLLVEGMPPPLPAEAHPLLPRSCSTLLA